MFNSIRVKKMCFVPLLLTAFLGCAAKTEPAIKKTNGRNSDAENSKAVMEKSPEEKGYAHLNEVMDKHQEKFYVYLDGYEAGNRFIPSGWMGDYGDIIFDEAWTKNPHSGSSCTMITYLAEGYQKEYWAGIYWQSQNDNWGEQPGYPLQDADKVIFWARGAHGGERIEFKAGGINRPPYNNDEKPYSDSFGPVSTGITTLRKKWTRYEIDLSKENLNSVIGGFCWVTNKRENPKGCTFYLDDVYYNKSNLDELRFLVSYELPSIPEYKALKNVAFVYDNALVILAFLARGTKEDIRRAALLADAAVYAQRNDRFFCEEKYDGRLRNAYRAGPLVDPFSKEALLPGWMDRADEKWYEDKFNVSTHTGNVAWMMIALLDYYDASRNEKYLAAAEQMGKWIHQNCFDDYGFAGYTGGYEGWEPDENNPEGQEKLLWKSTEHNIDVYVAFMRLFQQTGDSKWKEWALHAKKFVESMWNHEDGHFWTGTQKKCAETTEYVNKGPIPLDVNTWAVMALGNVSKYGRGIEFIEKKCKVTDSSEESCQGYKGFDFNDDKDGIWFEGTAQACIAYQIMNDDQIADNYLDQLRKVQKEAKYGNGKGIIAACKEDLTTGFDWIYFDRLHIGATAWFLLAEQEYNPYWGIKTDSPIPFEDL